MGNKHLYTVITDVYDTQEVFVDQVRTSSTHLNEILFIWVEQAVAHGFVKGTEDPQVVLQDIMDDYKSLMKLDQNVWDISFLIGRNMCTYSACESYYNAHLDRYFYDPDLVLCTLNFILTPEDVAPLVFRTARGSPTPSIASLLHSAEANYAICQLEHARFKNSARLNNATNKRRKQLEKRLLYWGAKINFLRQGYNRDGQASEAPVYTTFFYYVDHRSKEAASRSFQLKPIIGHDINYVFHSWATKIMHARWAPSKGQTIGEKMLGDQDRQLLMEKIGSGLYMPIPVEGCVNVWGTYFSLSEGMAKMIIVKTALEEVVQG